MAAIVKPAGDRVFANKRVFWVPAITESGIKATEVNATGSVEMSNLLYADNAARYSADVSRAESPRRLGSSRIEDRFTTVKNSFSDFLYVEKFQADDTDAANKARANLTPYSTAYIVEFPGLSPESPTASTAIISGLKCRWYKATLGPQLDDQSGDGDGDEFALRQPISLIGDPVRATLAT